MKVLNQNQFGYAFFTHLFFAYLQGDPAIDSIPRQLKAIEKVKHHFDIVVIVRGGGGEVGLSCYNNYKLCKAITECSLPVLTGIGHSTNLTVAEMVAHRNAITPTELGEYLLQVFHEFSVPVERAVETINRSSLTIIERTNTAFSQTVRQLKSNVQNVLLTHHNKWQVLSRKLNAKSELSIHRQYERLNFVQKNMTTLSKRLFSDKIVYLNDSEVFLKQNSLKTMQKENEEIHLLERQIQLLDPKNVLKRGYSITRIGGKTVGYLNIPEKGQQLEIETYDLKISVITESVKKHSNHTK
jgi:exodeoxyribonuclease VII large subunit